VITPEPSANLVVVACLGSSSTAGQGQAFGWINELSTRPQNANFTFRNLGVGGDLAYSALQRVPSLVAIQPNKVVILLGANDVLTLVFKNVWRMVGDLMKHIPRDPSPEWFRESLETIVRTIKTGTSAQVALCSLGPIGEDPISIHPVQRELNLRMEEFRGIIKDISRSQRVGYIPFFERLHERIVASPGRPLTAFRFLPIYRDTFRFYVLRRTSDEIGRANGWQFHVDGVHLNRRGGMILADLVQEFLDG
jgi:lysophospholipase L1-like esterase